MLHSLLLQSTSLHLPYATLGWFTELKKFTNQFLFYESDFLSCEWHETVSFITCSMNEINGQISLFSLHFLQSLKSTVQPVLSKHLRDNQNVLAYDRCLLNTETFQYICLFQKLNTYLHNTGCLLNKGDH